MTDQAKAMTAGEKVAKIEQTVGKNNVRNSVARQTEEYLYYMQEQSKCPSVMRVASLAAENGRMRLKDLDSEYIEEVAGERAIKELERNFGSTVVPPFTPLEKIVDVKLGAGGSDLRYSGDLDASITITNRSFQPIVISDSSFIKGHIRIDAQIRGDVEKSIEKRILTFGSGE